MEHRDQAEQLRRVIQRENDLEGIMTPELPSRSEYHKKKQRNTNKGNKKSKDGKGTHKGEGTIKYPAIKILVFIFLMLPILVGLLYYFQIFKANNTPVTIDRDSEYFDSVEFE